MKLTEVFPSNYLKSDDLQGHEPTVVISGAAMETVGNDQRLVLTFQGKKKSMICNKTNAGRIAFLYGDDTDGWLGKPIKLTSEFVEFQGKTVKGLRVKPPNPGNGGSTLAPPNKSGVQHVTPQRQYVTHERPGYTLSSTQAVPPGQPDRDELEDGDTIPF